MGSEGLSIVHRPPQCHEYSIVHLLTPFTGLLFLKNPADCFRSSPYPRVPVAIKFHFGTCNQIKLKGVTRLITSTGHQPSEKRRVNETKSSTAPSCDCGVGLNRRQRQNNCRPAAKARHQRPCVCQQTDENKSVMNESH